MTKAILGVEDDNLTQAIRLYEKLGFSVKKRESILEREVWFSIYKRLRGE